MIMLKFCSSGLRFCLLIGKNGSMLLNGFEVSSMNK